MAATPWGQARDVETTNVRTRKGRAGWLNQRPQESVRHCNEGQRPFIRGRAPLSFSRAP
jgi:hypothetical protein